MMMNRQFYVFFRITANEPSFNSLGSWLVEWIVEPQLLLCHIIDTAYVDGSCGLWTPSLFVKFRSLPWGEQNLFIWKDIFEGLNFLNLSNFEAIFIFVQMINFTLNRIVEFPRITQLLSPTYYSVYEISISWLTTPTYSPFAIDVWRNICFLRQNYQFKNA